MPYTHSDIVGLFQGGPLVHHRSQDHGMAGAPAKLCEARLEDFGDGKAGIHGGSPVGCVEKVNFFEGTTRLFPKIIHVK